MAYGARLESVLGASPRGFESPILRHRSGTVRFRIFYALFTPAFPSPGLLPRSPLTPGPPLTPSTHSPEPSLLPAHLVQAPALLPALLFLDDATPTPSLPPPIANTLHNHHLLPSKPSQAVWLTY